MRKKLLIAAVIAAVAGVLAAVAIGAAPSTGTSCATATIDSQPVIVGPNTIGNTPAQTQTHCETYTIPTVQNTITSPGATVTQTVTGPTTTVTQTVTAQPTSSTTSSTSSTSTSSSTTTSSTTTAPTASTNCAGKGTNTANTVLQANLDACGLPSMNTTGPAAGTVLTASSGFTASTAGKVYNDLAVAGGISITASNVTIENSNITDVNPNGAAINIAPGVTGVKLVNDSIHGTNAVQSGSLAFAVSYFGSSITGVTIDHTNFYNGDRILAGYGTVTDSYCLGGANFTSGGSTEHDECIYTGGGAPGIKVIHDTLLNANPYQTAAVFVDSPGNGNGTGANGTVDIENSLLGGGDYCVYGGGPVSGGGDHTGPETITNNRFARLYFTTCGQFGPDAHLAGDAKWSGNVWDDTGATVNP